MNNDYILKQILPKEMLNVTKFLNSIDYEK